jgi:hypothetical protein
VAGSCIPNSSSLFQLLSLRETERKTKKTDPEKKFKKTQPQKTGVEGQEVVGWSSRGIASGKKRGAQQRWRKRWLQKDTTDVEIPNCPPKNKTDPKRRLKYKQKISG